jgi:hypothetical protein
VNVQATRIKTVQIGELVMQDQQFRVIAIPEGERTTPVAAIGYTKLCAGLR